MYNKSANTFIRTMGSPGYSSVTLSLYRTNLVLKFVPYIGTDNRGFDKYCKRTFLSTSLDYIGAAAFYLTATNILNGKWSANQVELQLPCSNGTTLAFKHKPDENNQMASYLVISKSNETIPFRFSTSQTQIYKDGQWGTIVFQTGLGVFTRILDGYLTGIGADNHLNKLTDEELNPDGIPMLME